MSLCIVLTCICSDSDLTCTCVLLIPGCVKMPQIEAQCAQSDCVARVEDVRASHDRFCCCRGHLCNANFSLVLAPITTTERAPETPPLPGMA